MPLPLHPRARRASCGRRNLQIQEAVTSPPSQLVPKMDSQMFKNTPDERAVATGAGRTSSSLEV